MNDSSKPFRRHFRIYFKNRHPAYIVDEEGNVYVFHRMTHSKSSGGRPNLPFDNPLLLGGNGLIYIVKKEQRDRKSKFSAFELELKPDVDVSYPEIKKVGQTSDAGSHHTNCRSRYESGTHIKTNKKKNINRANKKAPKKGTRRQAVGRYQTSEDHDHSISKSNKAKKNKSR